MEAQLHICCISGPYLNIPNALLPLALLPYEASG